MSWDRPLVAEETDEQPEGSLTVRQRGRGGYVIHTTTCTRLDRVHATTTFVIADSAVSQLPGPVSFCSICAPQTG